ncbi:MAG: UvrD-helicase domain-containing protein [Kofleriaceae bacterium]|nr:UvrD-helicase domain-containing protein [Myxococcales bacterium]MCB9559522.1 UvrD-helicase domain-containing protein [Kofleriaceae bacterium]MCB9574981.1 UvrD-helicase domain-containing protein [Kofleriaceae bacterium]
MRLLAAMDLAKLNPPQREAVTHFGGPLLVLAGAGSGKTRVITFRIAHLLAQGVPPEAIAAVTFTNKAAEEMRERVAFLLQDRRTAKKLTIGTFHSMGLWILKEERKALGFPRGFTIYDQSDQLGVVREILRHLAKEDADRRYDVKAILTRISLAKNGFVAPDAYKIHEGDDYDEVTAEIYPRYQEALRAFAAVDFDDLITEVVRLLETNPAVRDRWRSRFRFVMVDEYQDTNRAQLMMVKHLVADHGNLVVVGDDDQSIYSWRGADPTNILRFTEMFEGARLVKLEQNYRSTKTILDAANAVINNNTQRHGKTLWSDKGAGAPIIHAVAPDVETEAKWVAREVRRLHQDDGRPWSAMAVMYRSNIQAKLLEEELRTNEVPYTMYGGQQFFERKEVKDVIAYLRIALNGRDELALRRIINYPARGVGATTVERLVARAQAQHANLWDVVRAAGAEAADDPEIRPQTRRALGDLVGVVERLRERLAGDVIVATRGLLDDIALYDDLRHAAPSMTAAQRRIDNVEGLIGTLTRHRDKRGGEGLADLLRHLSLQSDSEEADAGGEKVILTTLHGSKGLEFPVVFMVGLEEELLPHARTLQPQATDVIDADHAIDISEERRLCYVGITRAQQQLYITRACVRTSRGRPMPRTPSRFLLEIPDELLEVRDLAEEAREKVPSDEVRQFFSKLSFDD